MKRCHNFRYSNYNEVSGDAHAVPNKLDDSNPLINLSNNFMSHDTNIGAVGDEDHMSFSGPSRRSDGEDFVSRSKLIVLV